MGKVAHLALAASLWAGCSFIDDFDFEVADGAVGPADARPTGDGGPRPDGPQPPDGCADPCLGDPLAEFSTVQGMGALAWGYLADTRDGDGLGYGELAAGTHHGAPAWTDGTPPPSIVDCRASTEGACAMAEGGLLFEANAPGDGSDPVLTFVAPADGTYAVVADLSPVQGLPLVTLSRLSRHDSVARATVEAAGSMTEALDLFAGERGLITVAPGADPGGAVSVASRVRVSRVVGAAPLADCQLAIRFEDPDPFAVDCNSFALVEDGTMDSSASASPSSVYGGARLFTLDAALRVPGVRLDYSGDFTVQMWVRVDRLNYFSTAAYADWSAAEPTTAGGVSLGLDPRNADGTLENQAVAGYLFPLPAGGAPSDPSITCDADSCSGEISAPIPSFGDWHFYRIVRDSAADEVRFCIDGALVGTGYLDGSTDISSPADVKLGTYGFGDPTFEGAIDDVRVTSRMLPCGD